MPFPASILAALSGLSVLPYENLSKIIASAEEGGIGRGPQSPGRAARERAMVRASGWLEKTRATGVGGTCFSLTWWLALRLKELGLPSAFLMGDKGRVRNVHCALRCDWQGRAYLLDPGYMLFDPLPLPEAGLSSTAWISPNEIRIEDLPASQVWRLWSGPRGRPKPRFDFRRAAVSEEEFLRHWDASFDLPMMGYPVLNRVRDGVQYYLQKRSLLVRGPERGRAGDSRAGAGGGLRKLARAELMEVLGVTFGIPEGLAGQALDIVTRKTPDFFDR